MKQNQQTKTQVNIVNAKLSICSSFFFFFQNDVLRLLRRKKERNTTYVNQMAIHLFSHSFFNLTQKLICLAKKWIYCEKKLPSSQ